MKNNFHFVSVISLLIVLFSSPAAFAASADKVDIIISSKFYEIHGSSIKELCQQMDELGPVDKAGLHVYAFTHCNIQYFTKFIRSSKGFVVSSPKVTVNIEYLFPKWDASSDTSIDLTKKWEDFLKAVQLHEEGHKDIAVKIGNELLNSLENLPASPTPQDVKQNSKKIFTELCEKMDNKQISYDKETDHGATQGARLTYYTSSPPTSPQLLHPFADFLNAQYNNISTSARK